jgi:hypothetical protein
MVGMMENAFINVKNRHYTITAPEELRDGKWAKRDCGSLPFARLWASLKSA